MFWSCSIAAHDIFKRRVTFTYSFEWFISWNSILLDWSERTQKSCTTKHCILSSREVFAWSKGQLRVLWQWWWWIMHHRSEKPWRVALLVYIIDSSTSFPPPLLSPQVKKGPFVCGVSLTVYASVACRQNGPNLHRSVLGPIIIISNVLETWLNKYINKQTNK